MMRLLAVALLAFTAVPVAEPRQADFARGPYLPTDEERVLALQMLDLLNAARDELDLPVLISNPQLDLLAYQHSAEMGRRGQVGHHSHAFGVDTKSRVKLAFPRLHRFAENVARNGSSQQAHDALMASRGHRINRVDPSFTHVGIGVARSGPYQIYVTELFARPTDPTVLDEIRVLYTSAEPSTLPRDDARYGEVADETVRVPPPSADDPEHWTHRGIEAYNAGRHTEAVAAFRRALEIDPSYEYARFDLGRALLATGDGGAAAAILRQHLEIAPDDIDAWASLGTASVLQADFGSAETAFRRVVAARSRDAIAWYNLGLALEYLDRPGEAGNAYAQALHLDPTFAAAQAGLARIRR